MFSSVMDRTATLCRWRSGDELYDEKMVQGLFDRMSSSYERMNVVMSFGFSVWWRRAVVRLVPVLAGDARVLDAMSGMGETWRQLRRRLPHARIEALDFTPRVVERARQRSRDEHDGAIEVHCSDMLDSGIPEGSFDAVVSAFGVKTFDDAQTAQFAEELARILRPGGRFALIEVTEPPDAFLRALYDFHVSRVVPVVGMLLFSDPTEYRMLHRYLRAYGDGRRTMRALAAHPLLRVETRRHFFGCATSFRGERVA